MEEEINQKLRELEVLIQKEPTYQEMQKLKTRLLVNNSVMETIEEIKKEKDIYSAKYIELKKKLYKYEDYQKYQELETSFYYVTLEINQILNQLVGKEVCRK